MTKPYPMEMRSRAVRFVESGESCHEVARRFGIVASTVIKWMDRYKKTGSAAPAKVGGYRPKKIIGPWRDWLLVRMKAGDYTLQGVSMAETKCARRRRKSVPVWLIKKGGYALGSVCLV